MNSDKFGDYIDADAIKDEMAFTKRLCSLNHWHVVDVTRKSIEETAAAIISLYESSRRS